MHLRVSPVLAPQRQEDFARRVGSHELVDEGGVERKQVALSGPEVQYRGNGGEEAVRGGNDVGKTGCDVSTEDLGGGGGGGGGGVGAAAGWVGRGG